MHMMKGEATTAVIHRAVRGGGDAHLLTASSLGDIDCFR
jgi:hypothetical protein